jgi:ABC-type uncharacterized transport system substrate-binding protein|tara:strand:- start:441 stop:644 length:204 start_codon:yes stop_codon:yes gene_type:complete
MKLIKKLNSKNNLKVAKLYFDEDNNQSEIRFFQNGKRLDGMTVITSPLVVAATTTLELESDHFFTSK